LEKFNESSRVKYDKMIGDSRPQSAHIQ